MVFEGMKGIPLPPDCDVLEVPINHTLSGIVATTGQAMVKHFTPQELKRCAANDTLNQLPVKTFICMPMTVNQKTIGTLSLAHPEEIHPEDDFLRWVSSLANYLALITDRKQAEVSLRESEERLKLALEATQMGIWELNLLHNQATWAESCEMVYGLSPGQFEQTYEAFLQRVYPEDRELVERNVTQAIHDNGGLNHEFRIIHPDGSIHWVLERGRVFCDEASRPTRLLGIAMNITDRKQFEAFLQQTNAKLGIQVAERTTELKEAIAQLHTEIMKRQQTQEELRRTLATNQALLSAIPDLILRVKRDGTYLDCIPTKEVRTIVPSEHQIGKNLQEILPLNLAQQRLNYIEQAFQTGLTQVYEYQFLIDGSVRDEEARIVVSGDDEVVVLIRDITDRKQAERAVNAAHEQLTGWVNDLEQRHQEITLLNQMSDLLQACLTQEESCTVLTQLLPCLFPNSSGAIFLISDSQNPVEAITTWGTLTSQTLFVTHECFALRRGQPHFVENTGKGLCCHHLLRPLPSTYCCVPMVARGKAIGVLYFSPLATELLLPAQRQLAITVAQQIALALANLKLYETLQNQSIRDPLTGLFNRRYLEESLTRELYRAQRSHQPLSIIVIDVDHFKRFNDTFGHDAGDAVLRELGNFLQSNVRGSDVACRFGGEEMVLILPGASLVDARQRAEQLRQGVKQIKIKHHQALGAITISLGVACYPEHADAKEPLIKAADAALYRAKAEGRDRVTVAAPET
jgi:diguanylate cyclase (GGDEF)-like protein/PAS domain S-box-containing protein